MFLTLTYNNENLPRDFSLHKEHLQLFWKRVRKRLPEGRKIKYYNCGEYGDKPTLPYKHGRPHYHAIVFGLDCYNEEDRQIVSDSWPLCDVWLFDRRRGRECAIQDISREDIAYVTGYVQKKLTGVLGADTYGNRQRPFCSCSHFIGYDFLDKNAERFRKNGFTYLNGHKISLPRRFRERLEISQSDCLSKVSKLTPSRLDEELDVLSKLFESDMKSRNLWYPDNLKMMSIRFERWYNNFEWSYSKQIERDFLQKKMITSRSYI